VRDKCRTSLDPSEKRAVVYVLKAAEFAVLSPEEKPA
jgi:hypothetical protein